MPDAGPILFHGSLASDDSYPRRAAHAFMVFQLRRPAVWIGLAVALMAIPLLSSVLATSSVGGETYAFGFLAIAADAVILLTTTIRWFISRRRLAKQFANLATPGAVREVSMTESSIGMRTGDAVANAPYRTYDRVETFGDFVYLRVRGSSMRVIFSRELFTDESLAFLRAKVM